MLFSNLSCMFCPFLILLLRGGWSSHWYSRRRRKQSRMNPLLSVMLPLWLLLLCSATSISCPTMSENCFSSESLEDIYSGTFVQRLLVGFEAASPLRSFLISHQDLSVPVALPGEYVGFSFLWSSLWTDLLFHRYVPPSSTLCSTTTLPTGKNYSNLLWCDGKSPNNLALDLAVTEFLCGSAHTDDCSLYISLLDHSDQRLGFGSIKSPQLHHGNAGVGSPCLESTLVPSEFGLKPISLSAGVKKLLPPLLGLLLVSSQDIRSVSVNSYCHELTMCICRPKLTSLISRHGLGKLERLSLIDLSFLEKFISTSSHRGWERSLSSFSSFMERYLPSHPSYTESSTNSTNRFELYNQFELLTPFVMLQISSNNHIGLYKIFHEDWQLKLCDLSILSILISCLATKLAVCNDNGAVKALNYCRVPQV